MITTMDIKAAPTLKELINRVRAGEDIVIAEDGKPLIRLSNAEVLDRKAVFGSMAGIGRLPDDFDDPLPESELKEWGL